MAMFNDVMEASVLPPPAPLAESATLEPPTDAVIDEGPVLVENPIDFGDDTIVVPAVVADVGPEETEEAPGLTEEAPDGNDDDDDEESDPPVGALAVRPPDGGSGPLEARAATKLAAAGKPYSEEEARLIVTITEAIHRAKVFEADLDDALFEIGGCAHVLVEECGWTLRRIGQAVNYSESRISQLRNGYLAFPTPESRMGMTFSACLEARKVHARLPKAEKEKTTPTDVLKEIRDGGHTVRKASAHFHKKALGEAKGKALAKFEAALAENPALTGTAHNRDCLDVLKDMADESVKVVWSDPPYAEFMKVDHEGYVSGRESGNGLRIDCENNNAEDAVPLTIEVFRLARRVIRTDGCLVHWSAGMHADRPEVIIAAREAGWRVGFAGYWKKHLTQPCKFEWPWTTCVERFLVFYPVGGVEPFDHSQMLSRADVITPDDLDKIAEFKSPSQMAHGDFVTGRKNVGDVHMFEKPVNLCRFFIEKLSHPGDAVVDLFGCSGNFCIAAEQAKRPWTYVELNEDNFTWGVGRIADVRKQLLAEEQAEAEVKADLPF